MRFRVDVDGFITGLRFYKASANTGTHVAHLWTNTGTLLATATFTSETGTGWQTGQLRDAGCGHRRHDLRRLVHRTQRPLLGHALLLQHRWASTTARCTPSPKARPAPTASTSTPPAAFPTQSYQSTNYWVDVVLNTAIAADTTAPTVTKFGQAGGLPVVYTTSAFTIDIQRSAERRHDQRQHRQPGEARRLDGAHGLLPDAGRLVQRLSVLERGEQHRRSRPRFRTTRPLARRRSRRTVRSIPSTVYTMIVSAGGVKDLAGNALATDTWTSFYTSNQPAPVMSIVLGLVDYARRPSTAATTRPSSWA